MLNITLTSLQLLNLFGSSPLISHPLHNFGIKNSYFSKSTVSVFYLNSFSHLSLFNVQFTRFSMSPIHISELDFRNQSFVNHTSWSNETSVTLTKCLFLNCKSSNSDGGAIVMNNPQNSLLSINCSGFANCSTSGGKGGAIYCNAENISLLKTCFQNCFCSDPHGDVIYLETFSEINLNYIEINNDDSLQTLKSTGSVLIYTSSTLKNIYNTLNISNSVFDTGIIFKSHVTEVSFFSAINVNCSSLLSIENTALILSNSDIISSTSKLAFLDCSSSLVLIVDSLFARISDQLFKFNERTTFQFQNVIADSKKYFVNMSSTAGIHFNDSASAFNQVKLNTDYCWLGQATWDVSQIKFKLSGASISFAIICFIVLCIYIYLKNKINQPLTDDDINPKRRKSSDWNEVEEPDDEEILVINEEHPEEEEKEKQNMEELNPSPRETVTLNDNDDGEDGEIKLEDIKVEQTASKPQANNNNNNPNTYN